MDNWHALMGVTIAASMFALGLQLFMEIVRDFVGPAPAIAEG